MIISSELSKLNLLENATQDMTGSVAPLIA